MRESAETEPIPGDPQDGASRSSRANHLDELRELLVGDEQVQLRQLAERIENPRLRASDVGEVLPAAVIKSIHDGDRLAHAIAPAVETALRASIKRDPTPVTNALYPVMGAAIRKSIADTLNRLMQSFNDALNQTFSFRAIRWRIESWRTGHPYVEVVLCHTLLYRVEQVLLVHRPSGLLLLHVSAPEVEAANEDVVSSMLSAIQDFMRDSFQTDPGESLQTIRMGQWNLLIETGPHAMLAAVVRGQAPAELQQTLETALESIHREEGDALQSFNGDACPFAGLHPHLESCLQSRTAMPSRGSHFPIAQAVIVALLILGIAWLAFTWKERRKERAFVAALRLEQGLVLSDAIHADGRLQIRGWRDPLAEDPARQVARFGLKPDAVEFHWEPFFGLSPEIVLRRARARLSPPPAVNMKLREGTLELSGVAPGEWARTAAARAAYVPGVERVETTHLRQEGAAATDLDRLREFIENARISFENDRSAGTNTQTLATLGAIAKATTELRDRAGETGAKALLVIKGHTDGTGTEAHNLKLRQRRAEWVRQRLLSAGAPGEIIRLDSELAPDEGAVSEALTNRCVTFNVFYRK